MKGGYGLSIRTDRTDGIGRFQSVRRSENCISLRAQLYGLEYPRQPSPRATLAEVTFSLLTARQWAESGSCSARGFFFLTARPWAERGSCSARGFFFFRFCVTRRRSPRMMSSSTNHRPNSHSAKCRHRLMSSSANYRPFLSSFRHTSPPESFV